MINKYIAVGRITKAPEIRYSVNGTAVCNFTIALNRIGAQEGQQQADFINCIAFNKVGENTANYCSKGSLIGIEARLQSRTYDDKNGRKVYVVEAVCSSVQFLDTKKKEEQKQLHQDNFYIPPKNDNPFNSSFDIDDSDIQF